MYSFRNDYSEGAHPRILESLVQTNLIQADGYGEDTYSKKAAQMIKHKINSCSDSLQEPHIHFLTGGTQTNLTALSAFLRPHEAVIAAQTGHILVHETGAIEATGHKILSIKTDNGKITAEDIEKVLEMHTDEHMVKPKLVFISNSTEIGSIYYKHELASLSNFCRKNSLYLYVDGARLGSALSAEDNDVSLSDLAQLADAFYIGGTKNGALIGEALVICKEGLNEEFRFHMKQKGALLAKGRLIGVQFYELFKDDLYFQLATHANKMAHLLKTAITNNGYTFLTNSPTNQIFPILPDWLIAKLEEKYEFYIWEKQNATSSAIRLVTSWATSENMVQEFIRDLNRLLENHSI